MTIAYLAFQHNQAPANTNKTWNDVRTGETGLALLDETGAATGWSISHSGGAAGFAGGANAVGTGDAAWVDEAAIMNDGHSDNEAVNWNSYPITGLDNGSTYNLIVAISQPSGRATELRVNGGASQTITDTSGLSTGLVATFNSISPSANTITLEWRSADGQFSYINAAYIESITPSPSLSITGPLQPGASISGDYSNFTGVPTALTLTDSNTNSISSATEITDLSITDNGDGAGSFTFTMPALPAAGNSQASLLFGDVTAELTT